ncbi:hypothetical protein [Nereida sp. MMG025]|uniref:hypothetical protein n=1 Tax=Nereida sp. MMG025 TaxID=2909981 RepID=UPI001F2ACC38|nr:hypothetical protein [Nereida sp. MMG025]MCF6444022.1 hypothetical protein [Nereida sp. MMG025]
MLRLYSTLFALTGTSLAGAGVIAALASGFDDLNGVLMGAVIGAVLAVPVNYWVTKQVMAN